MSDTKTKSVFGPIPSRRLGLSLGIDLLPYKTCCMDCVYCECGPTTNHTAERKEYFPTDSVLAEIDSVMAEHRKIDYMTFSGVGEPTLHSGIGRIIRHVKEHYPAVRICLLTKSPFLGDKALQEELRMLDLIVPSLDASNSEELTKINRPLPGITLEQIVSSMESFRRALPSVAMWLELFVVPGVNDSPESLARFIPLIRRIAPDKVQLNSLDRPGIAKWLRIPSRARLEEIAGILAPSGVSVEIISHVKAAEGEQPPENHDVAEYNELILKTLRSRPCTAEDLSVTLRMNREHILTHLRRMEKAGLVAAGETTARGTFYRPADI